MNYGAPHYVIFATLLLFHSIKVITDGAPELFTNLVGACDRERAVT
jgi:hypothetical protein